MKVLATPPHPRVGTGAKMPQAQAGSQLTPYRLRELLPLLGRLQHKLAFLQQQCEEKQQLSASLQSELQIYESLYGSPKTGMKGTGTRCPFSAKTKGGGLFT